MRRRIATGLLVLACAVPIAVSAGTPSRDVRAAWAIVPAAPSTAIVSVHPGDIVLRQRLLPLGYAILSADAIDQKTGNRVAPAGEPLFRLQGAQTVYCVLADPHRAVLARARPGSPSLRSCLIDSDGDGRFDASAGYDGKSSALPAVTARLPAHPHVLKEPVAYAPRAIDSFALPLFVGIRFDGFSGLSGAATFMDVYGHDDVTDSLDRAWPRDDHGKGRIAPTGTVLLNGARIDVLENDGKSLRIRVVQTRPPNAVGVIQRGGYFF